MNESSLIGAPNYCTFLDEMVSETSTLFCLKPVTRSQSAESQLNITGPYVPARQRFRRFRVLVGEDLTP